jgi:uncharacterized protein (TIGR02569 family)
MASRPASAVLEAFGVKDPLRPLPGGRGLCFEAGGIVLRPYDDEAESEWVGSFILLLGTSRSTTIYRLPRPVRSNAGAPSFVHQGWTASTFLTGRTPSPVPWRQMIQVCRQFHADIRALDVPKPAFLATRSNRFHEADLVTWDEKSLSHVGKVNKEIFAVIEPTLNQMEQLKRPIPDDTPVQIIHGDLTGNMLFDDSADATSYLPPGIIDMTVYWRPADYAEAIIVADGLICHGQGGGLLDLFDVDEVRLQLLVRALYWRCLCFAIDPDMEFVRAYMPKMDFAGAVQILRNTMERLA